MKIEGNKERDKELIPTHYLFQIRMHLARTTTISSAILKKPRRIFVPRFRTVRLVEERIEFFECHVVFVG